MSLQYLGISHFPVLHRQLSSPTSRSFVESSPSEDLTQDNKDVLLERLNDLVLRLSKDNLLENSSITAIHSHVDKIEVLIRAREGHEKSGQVRKEIHGSPSVPREEDVFWGPRTPTQNMRMHIPEIPEYSRRPAQNEPRMTPAKAIELAGVAEELATRLSATVAELQARKDESDVSLWNLGLRMWRFRLKLTKISTSMICLSLEPRKLRSVYCSLSIE